MGEMNRTYTGRGERVPDVEKRGDSIVRVSHVCLQAAVIIRGLAPSRFIARVRRTVRRHPAQRLTTDNHILA